MKHKGGNVYGSIYERKRKSGNNSYTAEIQFHGQVMRRSSKNRDALQAWTDNVCEKLNSVVSEYKSRLDLELLELKNKAYKDMMEKAKPIMDEAKQFDLRNKVCAYAQGLKPKDFFQTYLAKSNENGLIKIGKSKDVHTRMQVLGTKKVQLIAYVDRDIEKHLHKLYSRVRVKGEWFKLSEQDVSEIINTFGFDTPGVVFISGGGVG